MNITLAWRREIKELKAQRRIITLRIKSLEESIKATGEDNERPRTEERR